VCSYSCGPFVDVSNGMSPFLALVTSVSSVSMLYSLLLDNKAIAWVLLFALALTLLLMRNSIRVHVVGCISPDAIHSVPRILTLRLDFPRW